MSRKLHKKSDMLSIGIFEGKEAVYNKLILEILITRGDLSTWEIAKEICRIRNPDLKELPEAEVIYRRSQKIYSVIQRKGGRLEDLKEKQYVEYNCEVVNGKWSATFKGLLAMLALKPELDKKVHPETRDFSGFLSKTQTIPKKVRVFGGEMDGSVVTSFMKELKEEITNPRVFLVLAEKTKKLVEEGINLDKISEDKFMVLISNEWSQMMIPRLKNRYVT